MHYSPRFSEDPASYPLLGKKRGGANDGLSISRLCQVCTSLLHQSCFFFSHPLFSFSLLGKGKGIRYFQATLHGEKVEECCEDDKGQATFRGSFRGREVGECRVVVLLLKDGSTAISPIGHVVGMTGQMSARNMRHSGNSLRQPGAGT